MSLEVKTVQQPNGVVVVELSGDLSVGRESQQVESTVQKLISHGRDRIVMDLGGIQQIDSTGVGIVTFCYGRIKETGGSFRVARAAGKIRDVFRVTAVDHLVPFHESLEEAIATA